MCISIPNIYLYTPTSSLQVPAPFSPQNSVWHAFWWVWGLVFPHRQYEDLESKSKYPFWRNDQPTITYQVPNRNHYPHSTFLQASIEGPRTTWSDLLSAWLVCHHLANSVSELHGGNGGNKISPLRCPPWRIRQLWILEWKVAVRLGITRHDRCAFTPLATRTSPFQVNVATKAYICMLAKLPRSRY